MHGDIQRAQVLFSDALPIILLQVCEGYIAAVQEGETVVIISHIE